MFGFQFAVVLGPAPSTAGGTGRSADQLKSDVVALLDPEFAANSRIHLMRSTRGVRRVKGRASRLRRFPGPPGPSSARL